MKVQKLILPVLVCMMSVAAQFASAGEDFYWKDSYTRGVGTIPPEVCGAGNDNDAGLCYKKCAAGYHGVGPVCWNDKQESYGRGAGKIPHMHLVHFKLQESCNNGMQNDAGLCYDNCKAGYHGVGPVCWDNAAESHPRGAGTIPNFVCGSGKEKDAGLCYTACKTGYKGIGPVCWGQAPAGYVDCGFGFASDKNQCALTTANQTLAVAMLAGTACTTIYPPCGPAMNSAKAATKEKMGQMGTKALEGTKVAGKAILKELEPLLAKIGEIYAKVSKGEKDVGEAVKESQAVSKDFFTAAELAKIEKLLTEDGPKAYKAGSKGYKGGKAAVGMVSQDEVLDTLRDSANLVSAVITLEGIVNPAADTAPAQGVSNTCNVIGAFMYPTYGH